MNISAILRAHDSGEIDWHSAREELEALGIFDDDLVRVLGDCPAEEQRAYREEETL